MLLVYTADLYAARTHPQTSGSETDGQVLCRDKSHAAEDSSSGRSAASAISDDQLLLHVFGLHAADAGRVGGV